jgi:hypothetical protein
MAGQLKATQLFQFAEFLFQCFDTGRTGTCAKVVRQHPSGIRLGSKEQGVHSLMHGSGRTIHQYAAEVILELEMAERPSRSTRSGAKGSMTIVSSIAH